MVRRCSWPRGRAGSRSRWTAPARAGAPDRGTTTTSRAPRIDVEPGPRRAMTGPRGVDGARRGAGDAVPRRRDVRVRRSRAPSSTGSPASASSAGGGAAARSRVLFSRPGAGRRAGARGGSPPARGWDALALAGVATSVTAAPLERWTVRSTARTARASRSRFEAARLPGRRSPATVARARRDGRLRAALPRARHGDAPAAAAHDVDCARPARPQLGRRRTGTRIELARSSPPGPRAARAPR